MRVRPFDAERAAALGADPLAAQVLEDCLREVQAAERRYGSAGNDDEIEATALELMAAKARLSQALRGIRSARGIGRDDLTKQGGAVAVVGG